MNALTRQIIGFTLASNGVLRPVNFYDLGKLELLDESMTLNPCATCQGRGEAECGSGPFDPDADVYLDDCPDCAGSGNAQCPGCDNPAPLLVRGVGQCEGCLAQAALEAAEAEE